MVSSRVRRVATVVVMMAPAMIVAMTDAVRVSCGVRPVKMERRQATGVTSARQVSQTAAGSACV